MSAVTCCSRWRIVVVFQHLPLQLRSGVSDLNTACSTFSHTLSSGGQEFNLVSMCVQLSNADVFSISLPSSSPHLLFLHFIYIIIWFLLLLCFFPFFGLPYTHSFIFSLLFLMCGYSYLVLTHIILPPIHLHYISIFLFSFVVLFLALITLSLVFGFSFSSLLINVFFLTPLFFFLPTRSHTLFLLSYLCPAIHLSHHLYPFSLSILSSISSSLLCVLFSETFYFMSSWPPQPFLCFHPFCVPLFLLLFLQLQG